MPNFRNIRATFLGINQQPLAREPIKVAHLSGNYLSEVEFPKTENVFYTNEDGELNLTLWCNEEGERSSVYKFTLPGDDSFEAVIPVGTSDIELAVLREGGVNSNDPQYQSLITYIINEIQSTSGGTVPLATATVSGRVKTNSTAPDPVVYLRSEVDSALATKANTSNVYTTTQVDNLLNSKANTSTTYTKVEVDNALISKANVSNTYTKTEVDNLIASGGGSGEVNTASNLGSGVGVVNGKVGVDLQFRSLVPVSNKISVTLDGSDPEINLDVNEANLALNNLSDTLSIAKGGTGSTSASAALTALGAASSADLTTGLASKANSADLTDHINNTSNPHSVSPVQIGAIANSEKAAPLGVATLDANSLIPDNQIPSSITRDSELTSALSTKANTADLTSHTSNTSNPHNVTASQVGNTTAQWNANQIQGIPVSSTTPTNGQVLKFNGTQYAPSADNEGSGGGGSSTLDGLTDVIITSPITGQVLGYNGTNWVNSPPDALQFFNGPGYWYTPFVAPSLTNRSINTGTGRVAILPIRRRCFVDSVSVNIATAASGVSVGLYLYNFNGNYIGDFGVIDASTTGWKFTTDLITPIELTPGVYSIVVCGSGTVSVSSYNNTLNALSDTLGRQGPGTNNNVGGFLSSFTFGSPPSTISLNYVSSEAPTVWFKVSSL